MLVTPALTENAFGKGRAFYIASRNDAQFTDDFLAHLIESCALRQPLKTEIPEGISVQIRAGESQEWIFVLNFNNHPQKIALPDGEFFDVLAGQSAPATLELPTFGATVLRREKAGKRSLNEH